MEAARRGEIAPERTEVSGRVAGGRMAMEIVRRRHMGEGATTLMPAADQVDMRGMHGPGVAVAAMHDGGVMRGRLVLRQRRRGRQQASHRRGGEEFHHGHLLGR